MPGNRHVRFSGEEVAGTSPPHPTWLTTPSLVFHALYGRAPDDSFVELPSAAPTDRPA
jgi:hypothetical protein